MRYPGDIRTFLRERMAPLALWLVAASVAVWLWAGVAPGGPVIGVAAREEVAVAPLTTGRVETLLVGTGDRVARGQIVATLDPTPIEHDLRVLEAERAEVEAELTKAQADARRTGVTAVQDKDSAVAAAERELQAARAALDTRRAELRGVDRELKRLEALVSDQLLDKQALTALNVKRTRLDEEVKEARATVALLERQAAAAGARETLDPLEYVDKAVAPLEARLKVLDSKLLLVRAQRDDLVLRAPVAGEVIALDRRPGEVAQAATPVARLVADNAGRVIACLPDGASPVVAIGDLVDVAPHSAREHIRRGRTLSLGPVGELPQRCWHEPRTPVWGRTVLIQLEPATALVPGTAFDIRFLGPASASSGAHPEQGGPG
ncbi:MAG: HlyD family secretion protein [Deltaproteobacteria bacterium]|nr:MAG: HlyD family secretion protein [Deltaproteobacteria bacterium]